MNSLKIVVVVAFLFALPSCGGCSRGARLVNQERGAQRDRAAAVYDSVRGVEAEDAEPRRGSKTIMMTKKGGVYIVPIEVNDVPMEFIFDTGASDICISLTEALYLIKQGKLTEDDVFGSENYQIADGTIVEGTKIILRKVRIGNKVLRNVEASVMHNLSAPLLLGQSALARFGKISIDYNANQIEFD